MYRKSVIPFKIPSYTQHAANYCTGLKSTNDKEWICQTCSNHLKKEKLPPQSVANKLNVYPVPPEINCLTNLEARLLSTRYPFMKLVSLPRGKQPGIRGAVVNVPVSAENVCHLLPRTPSQAGIIALKLKRKIMYKHHYAYEHIRPNHVKEAFKILKENNQFYENVNTNCNWESDCHSEDVELWQQLTPPDPANSEANEEEQE